MKKWIIAGILASMLLAGCGSTEAASSDAAESAEAKTVETSDASEESGEAIEKGTGLIEIEESSDALLPPYEYTGGDTELAEEGQIKACIAELMKLDSENFDAADIAIPAPVIYQVNSDDASDIKVWGEFYIFNYSLNGDVLETQSGGNFRGCMHLKKEGEAYTVTSFDQVAEGSDEADSLRQICDGDETLLAKFGNDELVNQTRKEYIAAYVKANQLNIQAYQDTGWDPVELF